MRQGSRSGGRGERHAAVVGAGLGGLSAAIRLAAAGWQVDVFEQQDRPGGKAGTEERDGYRFDTGPSLLTMPYVLEQLWSEAGRDWTDYLSVERLDVICNYFWKNGTRLHAYGDPDRFAAEVRQKTGEPAENVHRYLAHTGTIHDVAADLFLWNSLHEWSTYLSRRFFRSLFRAGRIDPFRSLNALNRRFFGDPRIVQLFNRYATYNGSSPYRTPATLGIIPYVEYMHGGYAVHGGIYAIPLALERLARELGVTLHYRTPVARIAWEERGGARRVTGVVTGKAPSTVTEAAPGSASSAAPAEPDGDFIPAEVIVSNVDVSVTYPRLLGDEQARQLVRYRGLEPSSSGLVFYWGVGREFPELTVNNIFFSDDYPAEFDSIFARGRCPDDPTIYINITSKVTHSDAPAGGENWFVLINAPAVNGQNWKAETGRVRATVLERLSHTLGVDVERAIVTEGVMTPEDIEQNTGSYRGALYGIASNTRLASFARHPNRSREYPGLYFCGGSAHPGGGMPLVLLSGKIATDLIRRDHAGRAQT